MASKYYFEQVASLWDLMRAAFFYEAECDKAYTAVGILPGKLAGEIGAGSGFTCRSSALEKIAAPNLPARV